MRGAILVCILLFSHSSSLAQDRTRIHDLYGAPLYEERVLKDGLHLAISYTASGDISGFAVSGVAWSSRKESALFEERHDPMIDETATRAVIQLMFENTPWQLENMNYPGRGSSGGIDSYRLGHLFVMFVYDGENRLTSVIGLAGVIGPPPNSPPN